MHQQFICLMGYITLIQVNEAYSVHSISLLQCTSTVLMVHHFIYVKEQWLIRGSIQSRYVVYLAYPTHRCFLGLMNVRSRHKHLWYWLHYIHYPLCTCKDGIEYIPRWYWINWNFCSIGFKSILRNWRLHPTEAQSGQRMTSAVAEWLAHNNILGQVMKLVGSVKKSAMCSTRGVSWNV